MEISQKPEAYKGHLMALATILIYSFNTNFMKIVMPEWIGAHGLVLIRCIASTVGFWFISLFLHATRQNHPSGKEIGIIMLGGALGMGANLLLYINGLALTGPVDAFVIRTDTTHRGNCISRFHPAREIYHKQSHRHLTWFGRYTLHFNRTSC